MEGLSERLWWEVEGWARGFRRLDFSRCCFFEVGVWSYIVCSFGEVFYIKGGWGWVLSYIVLGILFRLVRLGYGR